MDSACANSGRFSSACATGALLAAAVSVLYMFPNERQELTFALVGAGVFAFVELSKPGRSRLASKEKALFAKDDVSGVSEDVNCSTTTSNSTCDDALVEAVGIFDQRAQELVVLVERWAEDCGLASTGAAAEGKLPALAWQLLAIYFLQVSEKVTAKLPGLDVINSGNPRDHEWEGLDMPVATLFREFVAFYSSDFDWQDEAACVKAAQRGQLRAGLSRNALASDDGFTTMLCPGIEDPSQPGTNLGNFLDADNYQRILGELAHSDMMHKCMDAP